MPNSIQPNPPRKGLIIDAAGPKTQVGLLLDETLHWIQSPTEALNSIFELVDKSLQSKSVKWNELEAFYYGSGPGSTLGLRVAAMALQTWESLIKNPIPIFQYTSLHAGLRILPEEKPTQILSPWKANWFFSIKSDSSNNNIQCVSDESLQNIDPSTDPLYILNCGRLPKKLPPRAKLLPYDLQSLDRTAFDRIPFQSTTQPRPFQIEEPQFEKWTPQRHRGS